MEKLPTKTCLKCGHVWIPRKEDVRMCPSCHSLRWDELPSKESDQVIHEETTLADYIRIANSLEKLRRNGMDLNIELSRRFGKTKFGISSVHNRLLKVKSNIENRMFVERPEGFDDLTRTEQISIFFDDVDPRSKEEKAI